MKFFFEDAEAAPLSESVCRFKEKCKIGRDYLFVLNELINHTCCHHKESKFYLHGSLWL